MSEMSSVRVVRVQSVLLNSSNFGHCVSFCVTFKQSDERHVARLLPCWKRALVVESRRRGGLRV